MLALARGEGQSIIIDGNIEVKIVKWSRSSVRIAIQAPREVTVDRDEIWRKMHPGELSPLEKAEQERRERFAGQAGVAPAQPQAPSLFAVKSPGAGKAHLQPVGAAGAVVSLGAAVEEGALLGRIEAGESMQEVRSPLRGTIAKILASEGQSVERGQPLFLIQPAP